MSLSEQVGGLPARVCRMLTALMIGVWFVQIANNFGANHGELSFAAQIVHVHKIQDGC